jgi:hypothetical protein
MMKNLYLFAAVIGTVIPYVFFINFFIAEGVVPATFVAGLFANGAAGGFAADIFISSAIFWCYLLHNKVPRIGVYIFLNLSIGLSCALPLYLYMKTRDAEADRQVSAD